MVDAMTRSLSNGNIVRMGELGNLKVSLSSHGEETEEDVNASSIKHAKVLFKPGKQIREMLDNLTYVKE